MEQLSPATLPVSEGREKENKRLREPEASSLNFRNNTLHFYPSSGGA